MANVTLVTRDRQEQATHAVLLASVSPLMKTMLMEVQVTEEATTIILPDFTREEVQLCLNYLCRGMEDRSNESLLHLLGVHIKGENKEAICKVEAKSEIDFMKDEQVSDCDYQSDKDFDWDYHPPPSTPKKDFPCLSCGKKFTTHKRLSLHIELEHQQEPDLKKTEEVEEGAFPCSFCHVVSKSDRCFNYHMSKFHVENCEWFPHLENHGDKWMCKLCSSSFVKKNSAIFHWKHVHKHGKTKTFECNVCNKMFSLKFNLIDHTKIHSKYKEVVCDLCGEAFSTKKSLNTHTLRVHGSEKTKDENKTFVCSTCAKGFYSNQALKAHEDIHLDGLSYFCDKCGTGFKTAQALRCHDSRIHLKKWVETDEARARRLANLKQRRVEKKARNGGSQRTPEEKIIFNEYMRQYMARKKREKEQEI